MGIAARVWTHLHVELSLQSVERENFTFTEDTIMFSECYYTELSTPPSQLDVEDDK